MFHNLIFDWSGTLVDDLGPVIDATNFVLGKYGQAPLDREQFRRRFRLPYREFYEEVLPDIPLEELETHFRPAFSASQSPVTVLPHAREKLEWCSALGIRMFVLTSMDPDAFHLQLKEFGLEQHFEATYSGVLDKRALIHKILSDHQLDPAETAFVGDMTHDVETARHGGVASIAVLTGYNHPEVLATVRPDITVPDLGVLRGLFQRPNSQSRPIATVGALLHRDDGKVLMIRTHKWNHKWGIPGGKIDKGESSSTALHREIREETALQIDDPRFVMVQDCINSPEFFRPAHFLLLNYVARTHPGDVTLNEEAEEFRWLPIREALELDLNQPTAALIREVIARGMLPMNQPDRIEINRLQVTTSIGVPDEERASPQSIFITIGMVPSQGFGGLHDDIAHTVDYAAIAAEIENIAASHPRRLIETLTEDCASHLLSHHPLAAVDIRIEKHILPNADSVCVSIHRAR